jgi:hypothetical protein
VRMCLAAHVLPIPAHVLPSQPCIAAHAQQEQTPALVGSQPVPALTAPPHTHLKTEAAKKVPLEVHPDVRHTAGVMSMGRFDDPDSGTSSFSILLGEAPHLDNQYTIFGRGGSAMAPRRCAACATAANRIARSGN